MPQDDPHRYDDMLTLPHHVSAVHPPMPMPNRAAQFSPFAALTGYEDQITEAARLTETRSLPDELVLERLNARLAVLIEHLPEQPAVTAEYFRPDRTKPGGAAVCVTKPVHAVDLAERKLIFTDHTALSLDDILDLRGEIFSETE